MLYSVYDHFLLPVLVYYHSPVCLLVTGDDDDDEDEGDADGDGDNEVDGS